MRLRKVAVAIVAAVLVIASAVGLLLYYLGQTMQRRIVPAGPGALMAIDTDGLRELYALYALPKICGDANYHRSTDFTRVWELCHRAVSIPPGAVKKGLELLSGGTRAVSLETCYLFASGDFAVSSYSPASSNAMVKDGALKVEYVRLSHPSDKSTKGWMVSGYLQCECGPFP
jgi:hypothetical protein